MMSCLSYPNPTSKLCSRIVSDNPIMRTSVFFLPNLLLFLTLANAGNDPWYQGENCLTDQEASDISTAFENFYVSFDLAQAESLLADDFQSISDSNGNFYPNFVVRHSSLDVLVTFSPCLTRSFRPS
jgi:hypothetical protein